ncbi:hypothetical protein [Massilia sp. TSP1-1-2]|uniref:hypothetical protein n=1 Tax=Massilia sp. TSP1-1-2 TaxID=2804649 RepID=UPI003CF2206C
MTTSMLNPTDELAQLRAQIAVAAARMVAQDGADYATAKRKAATQVLGDMQATSGVLPDNTEIEEEVLRYQALFQLDTQPARLLRLRTIALQVMDALAEFKPYVTGPVLTGSAGEHDDIALQLFADSAKEVQIFLLDKKVDFDLTETPHFKGARFEPVETVSFLWHKEGVHAELYELNDLRGALKPRADGKPARADAAALRALMQQVSPPAAPTQESA